MALADGVAHCIPYPEMHKPPLFNPDTIGLNFAGKYNLGIIFFSALPLLERKKILKKQLLTSFRMAMIL